MGMSRRCLASVARRDPYTVLGIRPGSSVKEAKAAYLRLSKEFHPDTSSAPDAKERFVEVSQAFEEIKSGGASTSSSSRGPGGFAYRTTHTDPRDPFGFRERAARGGPASGAGFNSSFDDDELRRRFWRGETGQGPQMNPEEAARRRAEEDRARMEAELRRFYQQMHSGDKEFHRRREELRRAFTRGYFISMFIIFSFTWLYISSRMENAREQRRVHPYYQEPWESGVGGLQESNEALQRRLEAAMLKECDEKDPQRMSNAELLHCQRLRNRLRPLDPFPSDSSPQPPPPPPPITSA